ncbi:MAG TPA: glycosyltransferase [Methanobacterium sp.]|nr:glycosyltransferase [Methanobacterium sp.]
MIDRKNALFICNAYNNFQKDSIEATSKYLNNCFVHVRLNPIAELSKFIKIPFLTRFKSDYRVDLTSVPSNVTVYPKYMLYAPINSQYKKLGDIHFNSVQRLINESNLKFDFVHSHFTWSSGYVGAKLKEKYGVPFVVTAHGYDIYDLPFKDDEWRSKIEYVLNSADAIITVSNSNLEYIKKLGVKTPVTVLPNGYREDLFYPSDTKCRKSLGLPIDKKIIISVGNLEEVKGHKYLIEAMDSVVKIRKDTVCFIVGGGELEIRLKKQIKLAGLEEHVKLIGGKPHNEIPLWMNACDVFVLPSLNEGNPTVMFECLGCGKPFVGTKVGGIPEIIVSDDYGLLVEPGNSIDLAEKIDLALKNEWNFKKIREYGTTFTWEKISLNICNIYSNLLSL